MSKEVDVYYQTGSAQGLYEVSVRLNDCRAVLGLLDLMRLNKWCYTKYADTWDFLRKKPMPEVLMPFCISAIIWDISRGAGKYEWQDWRKVSNVDNLLRSEEGHKLAPADLLMKAYYYLNPQKPPAIVSDVPVAVDINELFIHVLILLLAQRKFGSDYAPLDTSCPYE